MNLKSNIAIISTSRSEFGVLKEVILHLSKISKLTLFIGGSHLVDNSSSEEIKNFIHTLDLNTVELNHSEIKQINNLNPLKKPFEKDNLYLLKIKNFIIVFGIDFNK